MSHCSILPVPLNLVHTLSFRPVFTAGSLVICLCHTWGLCPAKILATPAASSTRVWLHPQPLGDNCNESGSLWQDPRRLLLQHGFDSGVSCRATVNFCALSSTPSLVEYSPRCIVRPCLGKEQSWKISTIHLQQDDAHLETVTPDEESCIVMLAME